ncbi:DUF2617 family protein [Mycolicibacterium elephantis]|uniref:DUF2617 domain-containing protein n=1 Tax=Mycolicibacterium elephantis DSM 44368 TaxID=1335622 RepID=A0A439DT02_9MYCO|nr:DUF2617 family protein [Mycolicibacterium elephantis]MCV7222069.1 DUF2617 family protein [Mycolicibacterium elephantis]RWA19503.1 hypothetical protein MELE44368_20795 [Mycolicibacterium elephantis DSM 44368]
MPLHRLAVSPADVSGAGLRLVLNAAAPSPLAVCRLAHPGGGELVLGVLGASHVVTVAHAKSSFSEEVSCTAAAPTPLPGRAVAPGYLLESRHETRDETSFRALARLLRARCAERTGWLGGAFPGDDAALTALAAEPDGDGWRWRTWHLYPHPTGGGTVVQTNSRWQP